MDTPPPGANTVTVTHRHGMVGSYSAYQWQNIAIIVWFDGPTLDSLRLFERGAQDFIAEHPEGLSSITILVPGGRLPTSEARQELSRILDAQATHLAASAIIIRADGFFASALRGLLTALRLLRRKTVPQQVFSDYGSAATWLLKLHTARTATNLAPADLLAALRQVDIECSLKASAA